MDDFLLELRALDETQERVEATSDELLRARDDGDDVRVRAMVDAWMSALRAGDLHSERVAFLYVANHVLQKTLFDGGTPLAPLFGAHLDEAVSLVSNSPIDRQNVTRLLELWHEKEIYSDDVVLRLWRCTGEELPSFLQAIAASSTGTGDVLEVDDGEQELGLAQLPTLPMKLNAHSANPVIDALKQIDYHKAVLAFLDRTISERQQYVLHHATATFRTPEDVLADRSTTAAQLKRRVEDCLRLVKIRNKFMAELPPLKEQLASAIARLTQDEVTAGSKIEQKLEQCDVIDIGLADLAEHRETYSDEWSKEGEECNLRRQRREEEQRLREEQRMRLHHEAIAESAAHAMHLEAAINAGSTGELQSLAKELETQTAEREVKPDEANEVVWHPVLKELVPLKSLNLEWESWRDH